MLGRSVNLTTLFLGRLRPPKLLTSTSCNQRKEKRKYVARPGIEPRTPDLRVRCPTDYATWPGQKIEKSSLGSQDDIQQFSLNKEK